MNRATIIQSAPDNAPEWIQECLHTVKSWAHFRGYDYRFFGNEIFSWAPEFTDSAFSKVTRSDLCRVRLIQENLELGYDMVYWIDADFVIWNRREFTLPRITPGEIACPRETWVYDAGNVALRWNNSIIGLCDREDAKVLADLSRATLISNASKRVRETIIGTDLFSSRDFLLRKVEIKQAATLSPESIRRIMGPWIYGRRHLRDLSLAHGSTLAGANLCSSQKNNPREMLALVHNLIQGRHFGVEAWMTRFSWAYRLILSVCNLPDCIRCWTLTRLRSIRRLVSGLT